MSSLFQTVTNNKQDDEKIVAFQKSAHICQEIFIQDLELEMFIGVFENEKDAKQRVIVSAELEVSPTQNWQADDVQNIVSYADIVDTIKEIAAQKHIHLVETFAEKIIEECFKESSVLKMSVRISKPDIIADAAAVGAKITRSKY